MEFLSLLIVTLLIAMGVSILVIFFFRKPVDNILNRLIGEDVSVAWRKFLTFALFVVGVSAGVPRWKLEQFIAPQQPDVIRPVLTPEYWGFTVYETIIGTLGGMAWALLVFFIASMIAYVIVKRKEAH